MSALGEQVPRLAPVGLRQTFEKGVFALHGANNGRAELLLERTREAAEERVGKADDIGTRLGAQPRD